MLDQTSGGDLIKSEVDAVRLLEPAAIGIDFPARDWRHLADEQRVDLDSPPNYVELLRSLFDSEEEVLAFQTHLQESRGSYDAGG